MSPHSLNLIDSDPRADGRGHGALPGNPCKPVGLPPVALLSCPHPAATNAPFFLEVHYDCRGRLTPLQAPERLRASHA
jgi:hypothetical protein